MREKIWYPVSKFCGSDLSKEKYLQCLNLIINFWFYNIWKGTIRIIPDNIANDKFKIDKIIAKRIDQFCMNLHENHNTK